MPRKTNKIPMMASKLDDLQEKLMMHSESHELDDLPELEDDTSTAGHGQSHEHSQMFGHSHGQVLPAYIQKCDGYRAFYLPFAALLSFYTWYPPLIPTEQGDNHGAGHGHAHGHAHAQSADVLATPITPGGWKRRKVGALIMLARRDGHVTCSR